jgi:hypothetical protein
VENRLKANARNTIHKYKYIQNVNSKNGTGRYQGGRKEKKDSK